MSKRLIIEKTEILKGVITAPPSKSYTHRAIIIGSMASRARILNPLKSDDTWHTVRAWRILGAKIKIKKDTEGKWKEIEIQGFNGRPEPEKKKINVGESGTLLRFILPVVCLAEGTFIIDGKGTLKRRPNRSSVSALRQMGVDISAARGFRVPIKIKATGKLKGGVIYVDPKETSQVVSALLITAPLLSEETKIITGRDLVSKPYVDITIDVLKWAGIKIEETGKGYIVKPGQKFKPEGPFVVPGDYSSSAFLLAAACLVKSDLTIKNLKEDKQGDRRIVEILEKMGAHIERRNNALRVRGPFGLKGISADCKDTPDLVPVLTVLGCFAKGRMRITNVRHLAYKESNRLFSIADQLNKMGACIKVDKESGSVTVEKPLPEKIGTYVFPRVQNDHRVAMALSLIGLRAEKIIIKGSNCISKSYPCFVRDLRTLGARIKEV